MTLEERKAELRARMLQVRDGIDPVRRLELAEAIESSLYEIPAFTEASSVGSYWAGGSEVLTSSLNVRVAEQEGRRTFLPFVLNGELQLTEWFPTVPLVDAEYGNMHPRYRRAVPLDDVEVLLVPGLAFDAHGRRLGSGTGHYDRLLARLDPKTVRIGICFEAQTVEEVPAGPSDETVQFLATDGGVVSCSPVTAS